MALRGMALWVRERVNIYVNIFKPKSNKRR